MTWDTIQLAPIVLIQSGEPVYAERAITLLKRQARSIDPNTEVTDIDAQTYGPGYLSAIASPSLFGERRLLIVPNLENLNAAFQDDILTYLTQPEPDVVLILQHNGGVKGKKSSPHSKNTTSQPPQSPQSKTNATKPKQSWQTSAPPAAK